MINAQEYTDKLRRHFDQMAQRDEPLNTDDYICVTFQCYDFENFDEEYWAPALAAFETKIDFEECYTLEVFTKGNVISLVASQGDIRDPFV